MSQKDINDQEISKQVKKNKEPVYTKASVDLDY